MNNPSKKFVALAGVLSATALFTACDEEILQPSSSDLNTVASFKDLGDCSSKNKGRLVYVDSTDAVYLCADSTWKEVGLSEVKGADGKDGANGKDGKDGKNGSDGKDGKDGANGTSCTVKALDDGSGYDVVCGDKKVGTLTNGKNGADGKNGTNGTNGKSAYEIAKENGFKGTEAEWLKSLEGKDGDKGADGKSCSVKPNEEENGYDLVCGDETVTITNGNDGKSVTGQNGESCTGTSLENGNIQISCGGKVVGELKNGSVGATGKSAYEIAKEKDPSIGSEADWLASLKGDAGADCEILDGEEDGVVIVQCGEGDNVVKTTLYKAMCGTKPYDPEVKSCVGQVLWGKCGKKTYDLTTEVCHDDANDEVWKLCGTTAYDPTKYACIENKVKEKKMLLMCGTDEYDPETAFCAMRGENVERVYKKVTIGEQTWMAENLDYQMTRSWCGGGSGENAGDCDTYGRLYTWAAAMGKSEAECGYDHEYECDLGTGNVQGACPDGWHIPTYSEWEELLNAVGGQSTAGTKLKATTLWEAGAFSTNEDAYGFSALPAGYRYNGGVFYYTGKYAQFWSSTEYELSNFAYYINLLHSANDAAMKYSIKMNGLSVRCLQD